MVDTEPLFQRKLKRIGAPSSENNEFSLVAYNILCDHVFHNGSAKYPYLTDESLKYRCPDPSNAPRHIQLIKELLWLDGDIVCLQEVDAPYFPFLLEELGSDGYEGIYKQHDTTHGLATFYKRTRFEMKSSNVYGFTELLGDLGDVENQLKESNKHNQRYAQYTTLQDLQSGKEVVIVNACPSNLQLFSRARCSRSTNRVVFSTTVQNSSRIFEAYDPLGRLRGFQHASRLSCV
ncbi:glucose-repressible alcohol dehydrogenase transcriptional effector-like isoform X1 [Dendronephthya gigantea]|uniref:glucose-repressible alcohol dehydrogenase transcriptional effector-like isoform X1 n=1 Tax=Dendronephthya gigantea TaxID=151771 RepID=UPI001069DC62|nr:glucose-repressible alcohol dehydrogenase transcriptional effector-like isoform X1 [Dendronephthya gigantea]